MNQLKFQGATLAVTLILLFVVTLLGLGAIQMTQYEEKMSSNLQDKELAFNAAETALNAGEAWVKSLTTLPSPVSSCSTPPCVQNLLQNLDYTVQNISWWQDNAASYSASLTNINTAPRYIVEFIQFVPDSPEMGHSFSNSKGVYFYQITARGTGNTDNAVSIVQTSFGRRF